jgi:GT2 family glycosyltransferase
VIGDGMARSSVAVVIVTWNSERWLADCLASVRALEPVPSEITVVDSGSTDGSLAIARGLAASLLPLGENVGFCRANNIGIRATTSPLVLVLNPDTRLEPGFLAELVPAFDDPRVGIAAGKLLRFDGTTIDSAGQELGLSRQPVDRGYGRRDTGRYDRDGDVFGACGAAALYRRSMLDGIALSPGEYFDERFFAFYEDLDLAWRARRAGWRAVYRHRAIGFHARGGSAEGGPAPPRFGAMLRRSPELRRRILRNRYRTILRNDTLVGYLAHAPFIWARDLATLALVGLGRLAERR